MKKCYSISLTDEERAELQTIFVRRDVRPSTRRKAQALLLVDAGDVDKQVSQSLVITIPTVQRESMQLLGPRENIE